LNWIKVRNNLISHPHCIRIAVALGLPPVHVLGALVHLWSTADAHANGELLAGMNLASVDYMVGIPGFAGELANCGWIVESKEGVVLVDYEKHNGPTAKKRLYELVKKQSQRASLSPCHGDKTGTSAGQIGDKSGTELGQVGDKCGTDRGQKQKSQGQVRDQEREIELEKELKEKDSCSEPVETTSSKQLEPTLFEFPCRGKVKTFAVCQSHIDQLLVFYPGLDVLGLTRRALAWAVANPTKRKTAQGMPKFLDNWMSRAVDRESGKQSQGQPIAPRFDSRPDLAKEPPRRPAYGKSDPERDPEDGLWYARDGEGREVAHDGESWLTLPKWKAAHPEGWKPEYVGRWKAARSGVISA